jgi:hypothetical protein
MGCARVSSQPSYVHAYLTVGSMHFVYAIGCAEPVDHQTDSGEEGQLPVCTYRLSSTDQMAEREKKRSPSLASLLLSALVMAIVDPLDPAGPVVQ